MKFSVIGDVHYGAGYSLGRVDRDTRVNFRLEDFKNTFEYALQESYDRGIRLVIVTGDMTESRHPHPSEYFYLYRTLRKFLDKGMVIHIVIGNHDIIRDHLITTMTNLKALKIDNLHIYEDISSIAEEGVNLYFMPFKNRQMLGSDTDGEALNKLQDMLYDELEKHSSNNNTNFVVGHYMFFGTKLHSVEMVHHSYSEIKIPLEFFRDFDVVVMGHVHRQHDMRKNPLRAYVGSIDRKDFGEQDHNKSFMIYDTVDKSREIVKLPVRNIFDINYDYSNTTISSEDLQKVVMDRIAEDSKQGFADAIVKVLVTIPYGYKQNTSEKDIADFLKECGTKRIVTVDIKEINLQRSRIKEINENLNTKSAFKKYVEVKMEGEGADLVNKTIKTGFDIIDNVEAK